MGRTDVVDHDHGIVAELGDDHLHPPARHVSAALFN